MPKKRQMLSLADLMADEVDEFEGMLEDGFFDIDDRNPDIDKE